MLGGDACGVPRFGEVADAIVEVSDGAVLGVFGVGEVAVAVVGVLGGVAEHVDRFR